MTIELNGQSYALDHSQPIDLSLPIRADADGASAWYCPSPRIEPVMTEQFTGSVNLGGAVNFKNVFFNPHGNGTHTECVGHISKEFYSINQCLNTYVFLAAVATLAPEQRGEDAVISLAQLEATVATYTQYAPSALVLRTLPNGLDKRQRSYSNTNPPYVEAAGLAFLYDWGIRHFLIDTPSVDREFDEGILAAHHAFWNYPAAPRTDATITELIYVPDSVADGLYVLDLQVAAFENDASPSRPLLYELVGIEAN